MITVEAHAACCTLSDGQNKRATYQVLIMAGKREAFGGGQHVESGIVISDHSGRSCCLLHIVRRAKQTCYKGPAAIAAAIAAVFFSFFLLQFLSSLLLSGSTRWRFYPLRSSGQAVVTGVVPSPPGMAGENEAFGGGRSIEEVQRH